MGLFCSKKIPPKNMKQVLDYGIEFTYNCGFTLKYIKYYDNIIKNLAKSNDILYKKSSYNINTNLRTIIFETKFNNKKNFLNFLYKLSDIYKVESLYIRFVDLSEINQIFWFIFKNYNLKPDLSLFSKKDKKIYIIAKQKHRYNNCCVRCE